MDAIATGQETVIVAEDHPTLGLAMIELLKARGARPLLVQSPEEAALRIRETSDLPVILDGSVWRATGIPLEGLPHRVVIYTADEDLVARARRVGVRAFSKGDGNDWDDLLRALSL